jgi:peptidoglycan/LPS O-acetylase OafA/YrhL
MRGMAYPSSARSARIDFLRGVAIFVVLLLHFSLTYNLVDSPLSLLLPSKWVHAAVINGNYGVTIFFVISGFLITSNNLLRYRQLGRVRLRQFYAFRLSRIIPPLLLALGLITLLALFKLPSFVDAQHGRPMPGAFLLVAVLSVLTFWHNVLMQFVGYFNYCLNIYWSLSVEEVFYLTFPIACVLLKRDRFIVVLCVAAIALGPWYRSLHTDNEILFMYAYPACFDAIAFGCLAALLYPRITVPEAGARWIRIAAAAGLAATYLAGIDGHEAFGFTLIALCAAGLLVNSFGSSGSSSRAAGAGYWPYRILCWFGRHSYELYLFHIIVLALIRDRIPKAGLAYVYKLPLFGLFLIASALCAGMIARYFADPLNGRLRTLLKSDVSSGPRIPAVLESER